MSRRIVVPPEKRPEAKLRKVLVPLDGSKLAESVLDSSLLAGEVELLLLGVVPFHVAPKWDFVPDIDPQTADAFADTEHDAEVYLAETATRAAAWASRVRSHVVVEGQVAKAITDFANEENVDLIAMATHGRGIRRAVLGSVAERVMLTAGVPVLLFSPESARRAGSALVGAASG